MNAAGVVFTCADGNCSTGKTHEQSNVSPQETSTGWAEVLLLSQNL